MIFGPFKNTMKRIHNEKKLVFDVISIENFEISFIIILIMNFLILKYFII